MPNIYGLLTIGRTALLTHQRAVDITSNNISNVNTPGYSRQRLNLEQNNPVRDGGGTMSTGVRAQQQIQRFYDEFLAAQLNTENENLGRWEAQKGALDKVELMFDEVTGYGLNGAMSDFWNAWQDLSNNPSGHVERTNLLFTAQHMTSIFNQQRDNVANIQEDIDNNVDRLVSDINQIAEQIAELNGKVQQVEVSGHNANDFRDQRDQLLFELAKIIDVDHFEDADGMAVVMVGGGKPLVEAVNTWDIATANNSGVQDVFWTDSSGSTTNITSDINGGELKGWIYSRDTKIADYLNRLDTLATAIITEVNTLHSAGYALDGSQNAFFTGSTAADIAVNSAIEADVNLIAAASSNTALPGDNSTAIAIATLQNTLTMSSNSATFDQYYNSLLGDVGSDVNAAKLSYDHQINMVQQLKNYREEVSGVSLDEEMVNLIKFQHAYNSATQLINSANEMLDALFAITQ